MPVDATHEGRVTGRSTLRAVGAAVTVGLAGCTGGEIELAGTGGVEATMARPGLAPRVPAAASSVVDALRDGDLDTTAALPAACGNDPDRCAFEAELAGAIDRDEEQRVAPCEDDPERAGRAFDTSKQQERQLLDLLAEVLRTLHEEAVGAASRSGR